MREAIKVRADLEREVCELTETVRVLRIECDNKDEEIRKLRTEMEGTIILPSRLDPERELDDYEWRLPK